MRRRRGCGRRARLEVICRVLTARDDGCPGRGRAAPRLVWTGQSKKPRIVDSAHGRRCRVETQQFRLPLPTNDEAALGSISGFGLTALLEAPVTQLRVVLAAARQRRPDVHAPARATPTAASPHRHHGGEPPARPAAVSSWWW